jgi:hypothetical protein
LPPFAVARATFRFPATAALAARLHLGAGREAVLSALLAMRLADGCASGTIAGTVREPRALAAVQWLSSSCPDLRIRGACVEVVRASAAARGEGLREAVTRLVTALATYLDGAARGELEAFAGGLPG